MQEENPIKTKKRDLWIKRRVVFMGVIMACIFGVVLHRFYVLQTQEEHLVERAEKQSTAKMKLGAGGENKLDGHRGTIFDRNNFEMAISVEAPSIYAHPKLIEDVDAATEALARALGLPHEEIRKKLQSTAKFVWLARKVNPGIASAVKALRINGVGVKRESKRYYPGQELAGQLLGFVGVDNDGLEGIEAAFDRELRGSVMELQGVRDARGRVILTSETPRLNELEGSSIVLTLDRYIQKVTETALERYAKQFDAKAACAVVMDPWTGEVLALANYPSFNPNRFRDYDRSAMRNRAVLDAYEPGSVLKIFSYAAALEEGKFKPGEYIDQERGAMKIGKFIIHDSHVLEKMTAEQVIAESSNIGIYKLVQRIGKEKLYEYLKNFGFGARTGINIKAESAGLLWKPQRWADITFANISFGHGISTSPIQLAAALSAVANGGVLPTPWLIKEVRNKQGEVVAKGEIRMKRRVISEKTADLTKRAMEMVITAGTGLQGWVEGYRTGGKTGTAQKVDPRTKAYTHKWMANFTGIAPIDAPNIVVVVMFDEPRKNHYGGNVAAPAFAEIVTQVLPYRNIYPHEVMKGENNPFTALKNFKAFAKSKTRVDDNVVVPDGYTIVPDFSGDTLYRALEKAGKAGLTLKIENIGFVVSQSVTEGSHVKIGTPITVHLAKRYHRINRVKE